ncbi:glycosyltransferase [Aeromicrobium sp. Sec7.5]|uniref:glycosyltransferase n=1 Tax=Aeromicrobium sp. Sec7.5 TaxID=3121276 RepID=UPI002FE4F00F
MHESPVEHVAVVIPARDEERTVAAAVHAVQTAALNLPPGLTVDVVVVADACVDRTAEVALAAGAHVLVATEGNVGAARALGCAWALDRADDERVTWLACTDADSVVPPRWLLCQLDAATSGAELFLGTVALPRADAARHRRWLRTYRRHRAPGKGTGHGHVHGANLGVHAAAYVAAGGFHDLPVHEDADLVERLLAGGAVPAWADDAAVTTSARHHSRVVGGVATDLADTAA